MCADIASIHAFGTAPEQAKEGFRIIGVAIGDDAIASKYVSGVRLVRGPAIQGKPGVHEFAVIVKDNDSVATDFQKEVFAAYVELFAAVENGVSTETFFSLRETFRNICDRFPRDTSQQGSVVMGGKAEGLGEDMRLLQRRYDAAHERAYALDDRLVKAVQERFEAGEVTIEMFEQALDAAETKRVELYVALDGKYFMGGDASSVRFIYQALTGESFKKPSWQTHAQYMTSMEVMFGPLLGRVAALIEKDVVLESAVLANVAREGVLQI